MPWHLHSTAVLLPKTQPSSPPLPICWFNCPSSPRRASAFPMLKLFSTVPHLAVTDNHKRLFFLLLPHNCKFSLLLGIVMQICVFSGGLKGHPPGGVATQRLRTSLKAFLLFVSAATLYRLARCSTLLGLVSPRGSLEAPFP